MTDVRLAGMLVDLLIAEDFQSAHMTTPKMKGLELPRRPRKEGSVLVLAALGAGRDHILALELGTGDYLKPFSMRELVTRLRAILRRSANSPDPTPLALGALAIDPGTMSVTIEGVPVRLTAAEFLVLETLARSDGRVQSRETLTYRALGRPLEPFDRSIDTHISNIRRKLCLDPRRGIEIKSSRGHGYVLTVRRGGP